MSSDSRSRTRTRRQLRRAAAVLSLLALSASLDAQRLRLPTRPSTNPSPNYAAALPFGGMVATDLRFSEWFYGDHTVMLRFMAQYPTGYEGPLLTTDGLSGPAGTYSVGLANYRSGGYRGTKLVVRIGTREHFYPVSLVRDQWYHLAIRRLNDDIDVYLDGQWMPIPPAVAFAVPTTPTAQAERALAHRPPLRGGRPAVLGLRGRRRGLHLWREPGPHPVSDEQHPAPHRL